MDANQLIRWQLDEAGHQVTQVFAGIQPGHWDAKPTEDGMSLRESLVHLADCYVAALAKSKGEEPKWGSTVLSDEADAAVAELHAHRTAAVEAFLSPGGEESLRHATEYIVLHDAYHVGQVALVRMRLGGWEPYSIYR